jgi:glycosyltransferase involved in cell wall biosynthesis
MLAERPSPVAPIGRKSMRVALVATITDFGGIEKVLLTQLQHLDPAVELMPILFSRHDAANASFLNRLQQLNVPHIVFMNTRKRRYFNVVRNIRDVVAVFRRERFDVVHCHGYRADLLGLVAAKLCGLPLVSTCHGFIETDRHLKFNRRFDTWLLRMFERVIAVSAPMKAALATAGIRAERIEVVTNAVAEQASDQPAVRRELRDRLAIGSEEFVLGFVGRLSEEKGPAFLVDAAARLAKSGRRVRVIFVGDGPARAALEVEIERHNLLDRVILAGFQSDVSPWYSAMDAFVLPSLTEGTPMALLEAMMHRLPVVASNVGGVPQVVTHGDNGLLVPPAHAGELALAIAVLIDDRAQAGRLAEGGLQTVRKSYDVAAWTRRVHDVYLAALKEGRAS